MKRNAKGRLVLPFWLLFLALVFEMAQVIGSACDPLPATPYLWLRGEGDATDACGSHLTVLTGGERYAAGKVGQAFVFDGSGELRMLGTVAFAPNRYTVEGWVHPTVLQLQELTVDAWIRRGRADRITENPTWPAAAILSGGPQQEYTVAVTHDGQLFFGLVAGQGVYVRAGLTDTNWRHVAVTKGTNALAFYRDGLKVGEGNLPVGFVFSDAFTIGNVSWGWPMGFVGQIDEVAVRNRSPSAQRP